MKFVWLDVPGGGEIPVNPERVAYLRAGSGEDEGKTQLVFDAGAHGLHTVVVTGDGRDVAARLENAFEIPPQTAEEIERGVAGYSAHLRRGYLAVAEPDPFAEAPSRPKRKRHTAKA